MTLHNALNFAFRHSPAPTAGPGLEWPVPVIAKNTVHVRMVATKF